MQTSSYESFDKTTHFYRFWPNHQAKKALLVIHRGHEHSARLQEFAEHQLFSGYRIFACDLRGHGHNLTPTSPCAMDYVRDLYSFLRHIEQQHGYKPQQIAIVANSIAGVISSALVHDFAVPVAAMVLLAPAFKIKLYVPFAESLIGLGNRLIKDFKVKSYVKAHMLSSDKHQQELYNNDALITKDINASLLLDLADMGRRIVSDAASIETPLCVLSAGKDFVVDCKPQREFHDKLGSGLKQFISLEDCMHGLIFESQREQIYANIANFLDKAFTANSQPNDPLAPRKFSVEEYERLSRGDIPLTQKISFGIQSALLKTLGRSSCGMRMGLQHGFDSGIMLDYVYKNQPQGALGIGKLIDRNFLEAIGWKGIRQRKIHLQQLLENEIKQRLAAGMPVRILDIAAGSGLYLLELKQRYPQIEVLMQDYKQANLEVAQQFIASKSLQGIRCLQGDCFDEKSYAKLDFQPDIVVISGIFELFSDNAQVLSALRGVRSICSKNSVVFYTAQGWHPQLAMIANVLGNHRGSMWIMRRRNQAELDALLESCGWHKDNMLIDRWGIFSVARGVLQQAEACASNQTNDQPQQPASEQTPATAQACSQNQCVPA